MKKIVMLSFVLIALASYAQAQSAEYYEGYNAGQENQMPPDVSSSPDYVSGWKAGHAQEEGKAAAENAQSEPLQSDSGTPAQDSAE